MRQRTAIHVTPADGRRLEAVVADRNSPQKHGKRRLSPTLRVG
jgi:hypothetical protein